MTTFRFPLLIHSVIPNRKLEISRAPTKAKSQEPAYSQALVQTKIDRQRVKARYLRLSPVIVIVIVIVNSKLLKRHSKAKRRAPAYSRAPRQIRGVFQ